MPYRDPTRRRAYDAAYKRRRRAHGWTKKRIDKRLTPTQIKDAEDLRNLFNEVLVEVQDADDSSLKLEAKLRIKLRAIEIGLRVFEIADHEQRIVALEEEPK
jgi:hypothetical protein